MRFPGIIVGNTLTLHKTVSESDTSGLVGRGEHVRTIVKRRGPSVQPYFERTSSLRPIPAAPAAG